MRHDSGSQGRHRWVLPAVIALPFVVAVAVDVFRVVTAVPPPDLDLIEVGELRFEPADPVFDLRARAVDDTGDWSAPGFVLGSGWGATGPAGSWTAETVAKLELEITGGGLRVLFVEGRADRRLQGSPVLAVVVNGVDCGRATLAGSLAPLRFLLPGDALQRGLNTVELRLVSGPNERPAEGRTMLVRRVVVADSEGASFDELVAGRPLAVDRDRRSVLIRRPGRLVAAFTTTGSGSELSLSIRFVDPRPQGRVRVVVGRRFEAPDRFDVISARTLVAQRPRPARIRQKLQDRGESCALLVEVDRAAAAGGVALSDMRVAAKPIRGEGSRPPAR